jgi:hypothetical protein
VEQVFLVECAQSMTLSRSQQGQRSDLGNIVYGDIYHILCDQKKSKVKNKYLNKILLHTSIFCREWLSLRTKG